MNNRVPVRRAVEVINDRGPDVSPRWTVGSGFLVADGLVLTAAHNVLPTGSLSVRLLGSDAENRAYPENSEHTENRAYAASAVVVGTPGTTTDIGLLEVTGPGFPPAGPTVEFAVIDREYAERLERCWAIGFPGYKKLFTADSVRTRRESVQINGTIGTGSNLKRGTLELIVLNEPRSPQPSVSALSQWGGISGAAVFTRDPRLGEFLIGVITEHNPAEGAATLTVVPIAGLAVAAGDRAAEIWRRLGVADVSTLSRLPSSPAAPAPAPDAEGPHNLDPPLASFVGRDDEMRHIAALLTEGASAGNVPVIVLHGLGGIGKTTLANQVAHRLAARFPNARLMLRFGGEGVPEVETDEAYQQAFLAFDERDVPVTRRERARRYRALLGRGPSLVVLDNVARAGQVRNLLPNTAGSAVLITSRSALEELGAMPRVQVGQLPSRDGVALLTYGLSADKVAADLAAAHQIVRLAAGLPLALRVLAGRAHAPAAGDRPLRRLAEDLERETDRLDSLENELAGVRASFDVTRKRLPAEVAEFLIRIGLLGTPDFSRQLAAAVADVGPAVAGRRLDALANVHFVQPVAGKADRYRLHDLVRLYARDLAAKQDTVDPGRVRRDWVDWYLGVATRWYDADPGADAPPPEARAWYADEQYNVMATQQAAYEAEYWTAALRLGRALRGPLWYLGNSAGIAKSQRYAADAARRLGDEESELPVLIHLAEARRALGDIHTVAGLYERAARIARARGDAEKEGWVLTHYGDLYLDLGQPARSIERYREAEAIYVRSNDIAARIWLDAHFMDVYLAMGDPGEAARIGENALRLSRDRGDAAEVAWCERHLGFVYDTLGRYEDAVAAFTSVMAFHRDHNDTAGEADDLLRLGRMHIAANAVGEGRSALRRAADLAREIGAETLEREVRAELDQLDQLDEGAH